MGVPGFFKRLCIKYPYITVDCKEEKAQEVNGVRIPVDSSQPNPNHVEFDNLYLDMNEITHLCCNPKNKPAPQEEQGKIREICLYIDRLFSIVRPRRLLYMAFDGVAPRAKMNLQRSRRFRAIKESRDKKDESKPKAKESYPGTEFMFHLADFLREKYITERLNSDPGWKGIKVILSDAKTPGEGEHKIMDYIRKQRDHDPSTHHCLYGADTDLIMLGLATHEVNFTIIRPKSKPGGKAHEMDAIPETKFKFLRLELLKECLEKDLRKPGLSFTFDLERAIDDWVFMCFFVGNDFLPPLPSLDIRSHSLDLSMETLMELYTKAVNEAKGYLTENGVVNLERVQLLMTDLGKAGDETFKKRRTTEGNKRQRSPATGGPSTSSAQQICHQLRDAGTSSKDSATQHAADTFKGEEERGTKRGRDEEEEEDKDDSVRLGEDGWKEDYYQKKFGSSVDEVRAELVRCYVEGLCWVLQYYYQGCASWKWYFPYHYAPFASDFLDIGKLSIKFDKGTPLKPLEQLMFVLPPASINFLPETWRSLMINKNSPIIKYYPKDFRIDGEGKICTSQGVVLSPLVDEDLILKSLENLKLTDIEKKRNSNGPELLFVGKEHPLYDFIRNLYDKKELKEAEPDTDIDPSLTNGMRGKIGKDGDIPKSSALSVTFCAPTYPEDHIFEAKRLPGATLRKWRKSLLICGCLGLSDATDAIVVDVANSKLQIELSKEDIESSCRMSEARPRPIKVVLKSCRKREEIIQNCSKLRGSKIVIKDDDPLLN